MNAKLKVLAALAAMQLLVPAAFAQNTFSQITGRVIQINADTIVIRARSPNQGTWVIFRLPETKFSAPVRVGETVTIDYKMVAVNVEHRGARAR